MLEVFGNKTFTPNQPEELAEKFKKWYQSKTIIGAIIAILPQLLKIFGIDADLIVTDTIETSNVMWNDAITIVGGAIAWFGRIKARLKIG